EAPAGMESAEMTPTAAAAPPAETKSGPLVVLHHSPIAARDDQVARINTALAEAIERHTARMAAIERAAREHATVAPTTGVFTSDRKSVVQGKRVRLCVSRVLQEQVHE